MPEGLKPVSPNHRLQKLATTGRFLSAGLVDLIAPPHCADCGQAVEIAPGEAMLCSQCHQALAISSELPRCSLCAMPVPSETVGPCPHCRGKQFKFDGVWAWGTYEGQLRRALLRVKKPGHELLTHTLMSLFWDKHRPELDELALDAVVPVPMHWARRLTRGTNSAEVLAECLGRQIRTYVEPRLLVRRRNTIPHSGLTQRQRRINIRRALAVRKGYDLDAARILLVDDILTSGATCGEAARVLKAAGAAWVGVAVLARADAPN